MSITIKKYGNRRLYDTTNSRYVNLDEVARLIRSGEEVRVLDATSGEDLTRVILTQIIVEDARGDAGPPLELLREMVAASDHATREFLSWYLRTTLDMYRKAQASWRSGVEEAKAAAVGPLEFIRDVFPGLPWPARADEVEQLRRRVRELEQRLEAQSRRGKRMRRPARPSPLPDR